MRILCNVCGRPLAEVDIESVTGTQAGIVRRFMAGFGLEIPQLETLLNPTPQTLSAAFNVRCPSACGPAEVLAIVAGG